jgi:hypothetical protein
VIPDEVKAAALADLVLLSPAAVAAKYGLKPTTVRGWKSQEQPALMVIEDVDLSVITQKKHRITVLMLEYLEAALNAQIAQAYVTADPNYINRQPAESLAILHGVLTDKAVRLVEALQSGGRDAAE